MINRFFHLNIIILLILVLNVFIGCVELPTENNSAPEIPVVTYPPGIHSVLIPCIITVTGFDPDGDRMAYQFYIDYEYGWSAETTDWSDYYQSDEPAEFLLFGDEGTYSISVRARDEMNEMSGYSNAVSLTFGNSLQPIGSCYIYSEARKVIIGDNYAYLSTSGSGLVVVDISTPTDPQLIAQNGSYSSYCIDKNNSAVFLLSDNTFQETLYAYDVSKPSSPSILSQVVIFDGAQLDVNGNYTVVGTGWFRKTLVILDVTDPNNLSILSTLQTGETVDVSFISPYAYIMLASGNIIVVDCSNPTSPNIIGWLDIQSTGPICPLNNNYIYVISSTGFKIINISQPANPFVVQNFEVLSNCREIHINGQYLAIAQGYDGLRLLDISDPVSPVLIGEYNTTESCTGVFCSDNYLFAAAGNNLLIFNYPSSRNTFNPMQKRGSLKIVETGLH